MKQIKEVVLKIALSCVFWFSCSAYAADSTYYDRSTPEAAVHSLLEATKRGDLKAMIESYDLQSIFESDPKLKQMKLNAEQQQDFLVQMEGKIEPTLLEMKENLNAKGGVKEVVIDPQSEEKEGVVKLRVSVLYNDGDEISQQDIMLINRAGVYKIYPQL